MQIYECVVCHYVMGNGTRGPGVGKVFHPETVVPQVECARCGNLVRFRNVDGAEGRRIVKRWEATKGAVKCKDT